MIENIERRDLLCGAGSELLNSVVEFVGGVLVLLPFAAQSLLALRVRAAGPSFSSHLPSTICS